MHVAGFTPKAGLIPQLRLVLHTHLHFSVTMLFAGHLMSGHLQVHESVSNHLIPVHRFGTHSQLQVVRFTLKFGLQSCDGHLEETKKNNRTGFSFSKF